MKAITYYRYGTPDVLTLEEVEQPTPTDDQLLIKVHAVSINGSDRENLVGKPLYVRMAGLRQPRYPILGSDIAGHVVSVGKNITEFQPGDEIFGEIPGYHGGFAEYVCTGGATMIRKPAALTFEQAAAIPQAGVIALQGIRETGQVQPGQRVLINGAGGSAGSFAVQLAKLSGAEVTGVDGADKLDFMHALGADHVISLIKRVCRNSIRRTRFLLRLNLGPYTLPPTRCKDAATKSRRSPTRLASTKQTESAKRTRRQIMLNATTITTTFADSVARLIDAMTRSEKTDSSSSRLHNAYKAFAAENEIWVESLFDQHFLARHGETIVGAYVDGRLARHEAAVALAQAWETHLVPPSIKVSKQHRADAVMAADSFLSYLPA